MTQDILSSVMRFFEEEGWPFSRVEGEPLLTMGFQGESGLWMCYALAREEQAQFVFYSLCPVLVPAGDRPAVAEFLTRVNYDLFVGNFEMDWASGEVRFKTSVPIEGVRLDGTFVQQLVYINVMAMDYYLPGIMNVIYGHVPPSEAVAALDQTP